MCTWNVTNNPLLHIKLNLQMAMLVRCASSFGLWTKISHQLYSYIWTHTQCDFNKCSVTCLTFLIFPLFFCYFYLIFYSFILFIVCLGSEFCNNVKLDTWFVLTSLKKKVLGPQRTPSVCVIILLFVFISSFRYGSKLHQAIFFSFNNGSADYV